MTSPKDRARQLATLALRGATDGEKMAAATALAKMIESGRFEPEGRAEPPPGNPFFSHADEQRFKRENERLRDVAAQYHSNWQESERTRASHLNDLNMVRREASELRGKLRGAENMYRAHRDEVARYREEIEALKAEVVEAKKGKPAKKKKGEPEPVTVTAKGKISIVGCDVGFGEATFTTTLNNAAPPQGRPEDWDPVSKTYRGGGYTKEELEAAARAGAWAPPPNWGQDAREQYEWRTEYDARLGGHPPDPFDDGRCGCPQVGVHRPGCSYNRKREARGSGGRVSEEFKRTVERDFADAVASGVYADAFGGRSRYEPPPPPPPWDPPEIKIPGTNTDPRYSPYTKYPRSEFHETGDPNPFARPVRPRQYQTPPGFDPASYEKQRAANEATRQANREQANGKFKQSEPEPRTVQDAFREILGAFSKPPGPFKGF